MSLFCLALLTSIFWGMTYAATQMVTRFVDPKTYLIFSCLLSASLYSLWGYLDGSLYKDLSEGNLNKTINFALLASLAAFIASFCSVMAVKLNGATMASVVEISYPVFVIVFLYFITGINNFNWIVTLGGLTIFAGTAIVLFGKS